MKWIVFPASEHAGLAKMIAPGEARTHGLQIMRLTRCLLRYGGLVQGGPPTPGLRPEQVAPERKKVKKCDLAAVGFEPTPPKRLVP